MKQELLELPRWVKQFIAITVDCACALLATWLAFSLRLDEFHGFIPEQKSAYVAAVLLVAPVFIQFGVYRTVLRFTGAHTLALMGKAVVIYGLLYFVIIFMVASPYIYRSIGIVQPVLLFLLIFLVLFLLACLFLLIFLLFLCFPPINALIFALFLSL